MNTSSKLGGLTRWLPPGTMAVTVGVLINGIATYVFLVWPARSGLLDPAEFAIVSSLWFAVYFVGPGLFVPLEQELARQVSAARALNKTGHSVVSASLVLIFGACVVGAAVGALAHRPLANAMFEGRTGVVAVLVTAIAATGLLQWAKGWFSGSQDFVRYGAVVGLEGVVRAGAVAALVIGGATSATLYTIPVAVAPALAAIAVMMLRPPRLSKPSVEVVAPLAKATGTLAVAQLGAQFLMNGVPLSAAVLASNDEQELVGRIGAAVVLSRIPLFLFQAIQASLLPGLSALAAAKQWQDFSDRVRVVLVGLAAVGVLTVVVGAGLGPVAVELLFGEEFASSATQFGSLALSAILIVLALTAAQSLIALDHHREVASGWLSGVLVFVVVVAVSKATGASLEPTVLGAGVVAPAAAFAILGLRLRRHLAAHLGTAYTTGVDLG